MERFTREPMIKTVLLPTLLLICLGFINVLGQQQDEQWHHINPYFKVPTAYKDSLGPYRSLLFLPDSRLIQTPQAWRERREVIKRNWHQMMGPWPALIQNHPLNIIDSIDKVDLIQYRISLQWTPGESTQGYLLVPKTEEKKPAVITVYYEPETAIGEGKPHRDYAIQLAQRGFVTLSLGSTEATAAKTYALYHPSIDAAEVQPLSMLAYAAANAWHALSLHPSVDSTRIGIVGHSFGGKWAMFASCLFEKFACAAWSDPGIMLQNDRPSINYWEPWYLGYHPKPWRERGLITADNPAKGLYPDLVAKGHNLHELHALMAPRPFLVSGGSEDPVSRWQALNHSVAVNQLLGYEHRVGMTNRPDHSPNAQANEVIYQFFMYFLK
ncbi:MAG: sialidase [Saprospiraceae bacterium]|nr:sialidase [Saprospiraceae bacterium]